jgi:hypothetical protein
MQGKRFLAGELADARFETWRHAVAQLLAAAGQADCLPGDLELLAWYERGTPPREAAGLALADVLLTTYTVAGEGT